MVSTPTPTRTSSAAGADAAAPPVAAPARPTACRRTVVRSGRGARIRHGSWRVVLVLIAAVIATACGADPGDDAPDVPVAAGPAQAPAVDVTPEPDDTDVEVVVDEPDAPDVADDEPDDGPAVVARIVDHLDALDAYEGSTSESVTHTLGATTEFGSPRVLLVVDESDDRLEVLLPVRPNGTTGWIERSDVEVAEVELHVNVDLEARELTVLDAGEEVLTTTVAIGDADHPTPTGTFSITDKIATGDPDGPYGPYAIGLSGRSDVLTEFAGGDGQIGIHGTNDPSSIGQAASHGCVRVDNEVIEQLVALLPLGTPVTVT